MAARLLRLFPLILLGAVTVLSSPLTAATTAVQRFERNYAIGQNRSATVGEAIIRVRGYAETTERLPAYKAPAAFEIAQGGRKVFVAAGDIFVIADSWTVRGVKRNIAVYSSAPSLFGFTSLGMQVDDNGAIGDRGARQNGAVWRETGAISIQPKVLLVRTERVTTTRGPAGENFEIVFTGRDASAIRFQYREFTNDNLARPAFSQELSYPLDARQFRFRDMAIEIDKIGVDEIIYRVVRDGLNDGAQLSNSASEADSRFRYVPPPLPKASGAP